MKIKQYNFILIVIIAVFTFFLYAFHNIEYKDTEVILSALDEMNENALGTNITIMKVVIDEVEYDAKEFFYGWSTSENGEISWEWDRENNSISGVIPVGHTRKIIFSANPWKGKATLFVNQAMEEIDMYSELGNGTYIYEVKGEPYLSLNYIFSCCAFLCEILVVLFLIHLLSNKILNKMFKLNKIDSWIFHFIDGKLYFVLFIIVTVFALLVRISMFEYKTGDYIDYLEPWYMQLKGDGIWGLKKTIGNYTEGYMLFLAILTYLPIKPLYGIKLFSMVFDFFTAVVVGKYVYEYGNYKNKKMWATVFYSIALFLPTVLINSSYWGQCDSIYTFMLILSLYFYSKEKWNLVFVLVGTALAFKLQTILVLPVFLILYCKERKFSIFSFFIIPITYLGWSLPALLVGKPINEVIKTVLSYGSGTTSALTGGFNNFYTLVLTDNTEILSHIYHMGLGITLVLVACSMVIFVKKSWNCSINKIISIFLYFIMLITYFLPGMHERYLYFGDVISLIWFAVIKKKKYWYLPLGINLFSLINYIRYVTGVWPTDEWNILLEINALVAIVYLIFLCHILVLLYNEVTNENR